MCTDGDDPGLYLFVAVFVVLPIVEGRFFTWSTSGNLADLLWFAGIAATGQLVATIGAVFVTRQVEDVVSFSYGWQLVTISVLSSGAWVTFRVLLYRHLAADGHAVSRVVLRSVTSAAVGFALNWLSYLVMAFGARSP